LLAKGRRGGDGHPCRQRGLRSRVTSLDWATYPILTFPEIPKVEIELIDRPSEPPWGVGEPAAAVVPAAVSNAVFDAIGVRLRTIPYTPERVQGGEPSSSVA
jgi:CO/xanthine dehydrogenase Mo-binding subunit